MRLCQHVAIGCLISAALLLTCGCETIARLATTRSETIYHHAAVAADHPVASQAGLEMLRLGGNAVDAAVATSFCLSVVRPYSCGIGGGGFMLIYMPARDGQPSRAVAINYRETAPAAVGPDHFVKLNDPDASRIGHHAVAVPGTVAGLAYALDHYGTLDLATVLGPAIRAAEEGVPADANFVAAARELGKQIAADPTLIKIAGPVWHDLCGSGKVRVGDIIKQPDQAKALRMIAEHGPDAFYRGEIGHAIFAAMHTHDGPLTMSDLKDYQPREVIPLEGQFNGCTMLSMPLPSSGGIAMQELFGILDRRWSDLAGLKHTSPPYIHLVSEAMKHAFADRARWLADPNFVDVPVERLISSEYLDQLAQNISADHTRDPQAYGSSAPLKSDSGTSHFCVIDSAGMAVACTETINLNFGSLVTVPGFGFVLNNEMDDFTTIPNRPNAFGLTQSDANLPAPGKQPLSSMSPTILVKDGKAVLIAGASGGPRIITGTTQAILNATLFNMTPQQALNAKRFHHQWMPSVLELEDGCVTEWAKAELRQRGHDLGSIEAVGQVQMIQVTNDGILAASDPRKGGSPAGY